MKNPTELLKVLSTCADDCDYCAVACLGEDEVSHLEKCIRLDMDCAAMCRMAASYIARGSQFSCEILKTCAMVCDACAAECEQHKNMEHCQRCATSCRNCSKICRSKMAA